MHSSDRYRCLRRRYLSLGLGELAAATVFVVVAAAGPGGSRTDGPTRLAVWAVTIPLVVVLVQGGSYWLLARRRIGRPAMSARAAAAYRIARVLDVVVLAAAMVVMAATAPRLEAVDLAGVAAVWLFGVVEYVNYFVVRLAFPPAGWWAGVTSRRLPRLVLDLRAARGR